MDRIVIMSGFGFGRFFLNLRLYRFSGLSRVPGLLALVVWCWVLFVVAVGALADEGGVNDFGLRVDGDVVRVQLETRIGVFNGASLAARGQEVVIELKGVDSGAVSSLVAQRKWPTTVIRGVHVLPGQDDTTRILIQLVTPSTVIDETILATNKDKSRWELVLGPAAKLTEGLTEAPALAAIGMVARDGRADLLFTGSSGLVAEVSFSDNPPRLYVDLPGVAHRELVAAAKAFRAADVLIRGVTVSPEGKGGPGRLVFDLSENADLVEGAGALEEDAGRILVGIAPDSPPVDTVADKGSLGKVRIDELVGRLSFALPGIGGSRINAYTLNDPPQLVVDFLGWSPKRLEFAAKDFVSSHPVVRSARVESTRLGSGRLIFELSGPAPIITKTIDSQPSPRGEKALQTLVLALRKPLPEEENTTDLAQRDAIDRDVRRDLHDRARATVVIRPVRLDREEYWTRRTPQLDDKDKVFGLLKLLRMALDADSKYQTAVADLAVSQEALPQARAGHLPTASFDYQHVSTHQNVLRASNASFSTGDTDYLSKNMTLTITQPVFKAQSFVKTNQASVAIEQAQVNVVAAEQELILRLASAYLNFLAAQDARELAKAEREVNEKQFELARARLETGLGTITQLHDTEARFALTQAREIDASNKFDDAHQAIKEIIGTDVADIRGFRVDFDASAPQPPLVDVWVQAALEQNLALQARNLSLEIARLEIRRQQAGYLPTLNLVSTLSRQDSDGSLYGNGQKVDNVEIGVKLNVPVFEGGMTFSLVREAYARKDKAVQERELELRRTERTTRSTYQSVQASAGTLAALRKAVVAQDGALQARLASFKSGVGNILTVVDAYRQYYSAKRDYLQARYDYLVNRLRLKQAVGTLCRADLEDLSDMLKEK